MGAKIINSLQLSKKGLFYNYFYFYSVITYMLMKGTIRRMTLSLLMSLTHSVVFAQSFPNGLAANSVDPVSDSVAIARMSCMLDSIRNEEHRPTVAVVFSGGGAKGAAYIGILRYMEEQGIPVDLIGGTSMGGLMGGLYALGYDSHEMEKLMTDIDWNKIMNDNLDLKYLTYEQKAYKSIFFLSIPFFYDDKARNQREMLFGSDQADGSTSGPMDKRKLLSTIPFGYNSGFNIDNLLSRLSVGYQGDVDFTELPIPFYCVSSDLVTAKAKYHTSGSIKTAMRSTMSIPGVFNPVRSDRLILVDGGTRNNFPIDMAGAAGADIIVGVEVASRDVEYSQVNSAIDVMSCMIKMLGDDARSNEDYSADLYVKPSTGNISMLSFNSEAIAKMIESGYEAAKGHDEEFAAIKRRVGVFDYDKWLSGLKPDVTHLDGKSVMVTDVRVKGIPSEEEFMFRRILGIRDSAMVTTSDIEDAMCRIKSTGAFETVRYSLLDRDNDDSYTLLLECTPGQVHNFGFAFRADTENWAGIIANLTLNAHRLTGWRYDFTLDLGSRHGIDVTVSYRKNYMAQLNASLSLFHSRHDLASRSEAMKLDIGYLGARGELFVSSAHGLSYDFKCGVRADAATMPRKWFKSSRPDVWSPSDSQSKGCYLSGFVCSGFNTMNDVQFPSRGIRAKLEMECRFFKFGHDYSPTPSISASFQSVIPVTRWLSLIPDLHYRSLFSDYTREDEGYSIMNNNFVGGSFADRYVYGEIPFVGLNDPYMAQNHVFVANLDVRFRLANKLYLSALLGAVRENDSFAGLFSSVEPSFWACGMELGYRMGIGPLKVNVHWSDFSRNFDYYISVGYDF